MRLPYVVVNYEEKIYVLDNLCKFVVTYSNINWQASIEHHSLIADNGGSI